MKAVSRSEQPLYTFIFSQCFRTQSAMMFIVWHACKGGDLYDLDPCLPHIWRHYPPHSLVLLRILRTIDTMEGPYLWHYYSCMINFLNILFIWTQICIQYLQNSADLHTTSALETLHYLSFKCSSIQYHWSTIVRSYDWSLELQNGKCARLQHLVHNSTFSGRHSKTRLRAEPA